jgi:peptidoglycan/LPS O-acetylase OafA/YrhL
MYNKTSGIISIQLLRAIAALSIVYGHCTVLGDYHFPNAGLFGVDIFFVISGFIIAYSVTKNTDQFFVRRLARIVPLYVLATLAMTLTVILFPHQIRTATNTTVSVSRFIKSILFIPVTENYGYPILGQGWTLNYEVFFYLIMSLCIMFVKNKKYLPVVCASVLVSVTALAYIGDFDNFFVNYYGKGPLPEFIYGIILYHCYSYLNKKINVGGGGDYGILLGLSACLL